MGTLANVMKEAACRCMTDTLIIFAQVMASATVESVTVRKDGLERSVSIPFHAPSPLQKAQKNAKEVSACRVLVEESASVECAHAFLLETTEYMERIVSVMTDSVKMLMDINVEIMAFALVVNAFARMDGLENCVNM